MPDLDASHSTTNECVKSGNWSTGAVDKALELLEHVLSPCESDLGQQACEGRGDGPVALDEALIVSGEAEEATESADASSRRPPRPSGNPSPRRQLTPRAPGRTPTARRTRAWIA